MERKIEEMDDSGLLVVEDNRLDLELMLRALKKCGVPDKITVVRDGAEALDFIFCEGRFAGRSNGKPRMILLDLKLPLVDGLQVLRRVRGDVRTRSLPVIVFTASNRDEDITESHRLGVSGYMLKPVDAEKLGQALKRLGSIA
jgi:CheY-like chemotaxis protein